MCIDHKINRGQYCDITMSKANAVLGCGLTTTGIFFLMPSLGHKCLEECHESENPDSFGGKPYYTRVS